MNDYIDRMRSGAASATSLGQDRRLAETRHHPGGFSGEHPRPGAPGRRGDGLRLNLAFIVVVSGLLCGLAGWQIWRSRDDAIARSQARFDNFTQALAVQVTHMMQVTDLLLADVADQADPARLPSRDEQELRRGMGRLQALAPDFLTIVLTDAAGHVLQGASDAQPGPTSAATPPAWFAELRDDPGELAIGRPVAGPEGRGLLLPIGRRLTDAAGRFSGEAVALWSLDRFADSLDVIATSPNSMFNLIRGDGALLFRKPAVSAREIMTANAWPATLAAMQGPAGHYELVSQVDGLLRQISYVALPGHRLIVAAGQPTADVLAEWRRSTALLLAVLTVMLGMVGGLGRLQSRQVRRIARARCDLQRVAADLHASEARYRLLAENASDMIVELDLQGRRTYVSPGSRAVLGYEPEELIGVSTFNFVHPADVDQVRARVAAVAAGRGDTRATNRCLHKAGHTVWIETSLRLVRDPQTGQPAQIVSVVRDITARRLDELRIRQLAASDALTGLANRRQFIESLEQALGATRPGAHCAVLFIDLDKFKPINDLHGHSAGDAILRCVAERLRALAPPDGLTGRLGGDEFAMLLSGLPGAEPAQALAERIVAKLALPVVIGDLRVEIGASVGIAVSPRDAGDAEALLRLADIAMYSAKRAGGSRLAWFQPAMETELAREAAVKGRLRGAILGGEIVPYYQKLIRLQDGALVGFEVLARWHHPEQGVVMPDRFIAVAEEMGLVGAMFEHLLRQVCRDAVCWPEPLRVALNVSPLQLQDPDLAARITAILAEGGLPAHRLELEITENALIRDLATAKQVVADLQETGIRVALDDFGTGYASVTHLKELRFDRIKIDRSFARSAAWDRDSQRYLAIIVGLGKSLGLEVTAEGIEDAATLRHMTELGCTYGQGYLFGRAQPAAMLELAALPDVA